MTDKPRDLGDYQSAVDAYVASGYSREGAEAAIDQHCQIVASHKPPAPPPPEPIAEPKSDLEPEPAQEQESASDQADTEAAKEEETV